MEEIFNRGSAADDKTPSANTNTAADDMPSQPCEELRQSHDDTSSQDNKPVVPVAPDRRRRRSSLGSLAQFVRRNSAEAGPSVVNHALLANEAAHRFQFRSPAVKDA